MKRRVRRSNMKGVITAVHLNNCNGTVSYDITPSQGVPHIDVSEFDIVKSASATLRRATQSEINTCDLNAYNHRNDAQ